MATADCTLGELADLYIEMQELSPSTIRGYRSIRKNAFQSIVNVSIGRLTKDMYQAAVNEYKVGRSPKTVLSAHAFYNKVLNRYGVTVGNTASLPKMRKPKRKYPSTEEVQMFMENIKDTPLYLYCLFSVCLGLRKSETIGLLWEHIDFERNIVHICQAKVRDEYGEYVVKDPKSYESTRDLHLPQVLRGVLEKIDDKEGFVIKGSPKGMESLYQRQSKKFDFPYNFHGLRHYYAAVVLAHGIPNKYAQERMGHASEDMLKNVYQYTLKKVENEHDTILDKFFASAF